MAEVGLLKFKAEKSDGDETPLGASRLADNAGIERTKPELVSIVKRKEKSQKHFLNHSTR